MAKITDNITWFGHASFLIRGATGQNLYFVDPFDLKSVPDKKADAIFITHAHYDHWSPNDIRKLIGNNTTVVAASGCENLNLPQNRFIIVGPGRNISIAGIRVKTVPAYNVKQERLGYHPKEKNWVGYVFDVDGAKVYHAGDTDFVPEMRDIYDINVVMLPIGGTYTMDVREAILAANVIKAEVTVPMHYKRLLGSRAEEAEKEFKAGVKGKVFFMEEFS